MWQSEENRGRESREVRGGTGVEDRKMREGEGRDREEGDGVDFAPLCKNSCGRPLFYIATVVPEFALRH